jgi:pyruvate/2-oxoglutarate dehydrogenase complex dihydrolipoamide dehydrogenase (E3) component
VNGRLETNVPGVWALGAVKGGPAFTHVAYNDYQIVDANLIGGTQLSAAGRLVPYAVFTDPQLGRVGLTEKEARQTGRPFLKERRAPRVERGGVGRGVELCQHALLVLSVAAQDGPFDQAE